MPPECRGVSLQAAASRRRLARAGRLLAPLAGAFALVTLLVTPALGAPASQPRRADDVLQYPAEMPPISVEVLQDGVDSKGTWLQTIRLTIQPGGTLADASLVVFGDVNHVDALFAAAQKKNPHLTSPAMIPGGQQIDLSIDASTVFPLQATLHTSNTVVQRFSNGVMNTVYLHPPGSLRRVVTFPDNRPTDLFVWPTAQGPVKVRPGGKLVDLVYGAGQSFGDVVRQAFGLTTYAAAQDLTRQTGWDPTRWPPPVGEAKRVVVGPLETYTVAPPAVAAIPNPDPLGRARQEALQAERHQVGIDPIRIESFGQVYHVAINNPSLTASDVSRLIYGAPDRRDAIARAAGFQVPRPTAGAAASFDPHLFGRAFDLPVDFADESFVLRRNVSEAGVTEVELVNGTRLTTYPPAPAGPICVVAYPTGYKRIAYRPPKAILTVAQGIALFHAASDLTLSSSAADALLRRSVAEVVWRWAPDVPRSPDDLADELELVDDPAGPYVDVLVAPPGPRTLVERAYDLLRLRNPLTATIALVVLGTVVVLSVELVRRSARGARRARW